MLNRRVVRLCIQIAAPSIAIFLLAAAAAAGSSLQPANPQEEAEHEALRKLRSLYEQAIREQRLDLLAPHLHPDFQGVMITGESVGSIDDLRAYWQKIRGLMGEGGTYTTVVKPELSVLVGSLALARGTTDDTVVTSDGSTFQFSTAWTAVCEKVDDQWTIRRVQGSMDPVTNPFVREFTRRALLRTAIASAGVGLVLGWLLFWFLGRRRAKGA